MKFAIALFVASASLVATCAWADDTSSAGPYKLIKTSKVGGEGRWDYLAADPGGRRLYIPRLRSNNDRIDVFDLDSLAKVGEITGTINAHGVAIDPVSGHAFTSNRGDSRANPKVGPSVTMFDTKTLAVIKTIDVTGGPDGILYDPASKHVFVESHAQPNLTVINAADGTVITTIDLGGTPEQGASDGTGHVYFNLERQNQIAVVDSSTNTVTAHWDLGDNKGPTGMGLDAKNHVLFACCGGSSTMAIVDTNTGKIITTVKTGPDADAGGFNPETMEAFSANADSTLTVVKENSPTDFSVEENVPTKQGARSLAIDTKTGNILLCTCEFEAPTTQTDASGRPARPKAVPDSFMILEVGK